MNDVDDTGNRAPDSGTPAQGISVDELLTLQTELAGQGIYHSLDSLLSGKCGLESCGPEGLLLRLRQNILRRVPLFAALPADKLLALASACENMMLPPGEIVFRPKDAFDSYYVVASGAVRIYRRNEDSTVVTLAMRGPGEGFGEISLLTGQPHSVYAETVERTSLMLIPGDTVLDTVFSDPATAHTCSKILAERLSRGYTQIAAVSSTGQAYRHFISEQLMKKEPMFIGSSQAVMKIVAEIAAVSGSDEPVLVAGEPGTELADIAGLIHDMGRDGRGMHLGMDARTRRSNDFGTAGSGDPERIGLIQAGILFGRGYNALPFAPDRQLGLLVMAMGGSVVIHDIEYLAPLAQELLADYIERREFTAVGESEQLTSDARIIGTTCADLSAMAEAGTFNKRLYRLISLLTLTAVPLRMRKRDISLIVDELIKRFNRQLDKNIEGIDGEAYKSLMDYDWPGNTDELRVVIRRAVSIATGDRLMLDDLFIGPPPVTGKYTFNLLRVPAVLQTLRSRYYPRAAHLMTIPFIGLLIGLGLFGPQDPGRNAMLILTWAYWEPMLILGVLFSGRVWCSVCPMGAMSALVQQAAGLRLRVPTLIRNYGFYFGAAGIAAIFWAETAFDMPRSPRATAMLVITILLMACLAGLLFQRRAWCRYLCPLGSIVGVFANCAIIEMRSNYGVCNNTCTRHDCFAGNTEREGCPMSEGPFSLNSNRNCVLCATCVKICPNQSPVLNLRLPGYDLWTARKAELGFAIIVISLIGTQLFRGLETAGALNIFTTMGVGLGAGSGMLVLGSIAVTAVFAMAAGRAVFRKSVSQDENDYLFIAYGLLPLVLAFEANFHLERLLTMGGQILPVLGRQLESAALLPGASAPPSMIKALQVFLLLLGGAGSAAVLGKLRTRTSGTAKEGCVRRIIEKWPVLLLMTVYLLLFLKAGL